MGRRTIRLAEILKAEISETILRKLNDRRIGFISITHVDVSPDLTQATVYYSQIGSPADKKHTQRALKRATGFIQFEVGKHLQTRIVPHLSFVFDQSLEDGVRMVHRINEIAAAND